MHVSICVYNGACCTINPLNMHGVLKCAVKLICVGKFGNSGCTYIHVCEYV